MTEWLSSDPQPVFIPSQHPELAPLLRKSTNQEPACQVAPLNGLRGLNCFHHSISGRGSFLRYLSQTYCCHLSVGNHTTPATVCWGCGFSCQSKCNYDTYLRKCGTGLADSPKAVISVFLFLLSCICLLIIWDKKIFIWTLYSSSNSQMICLLKKSYHLEIEREIHNERDNKRER